MSLEIVVLVILAGAFVVMKMVQGDMERKRRLERSERLLRDKAATGGFSEKKKWDDFPEEQESPLIPETTDSLHGSVDSDDD